MGFFGENDYGLPPETGKVEVPDPDRRLRRKEAKAGWRLVVSASRWSMPESTVKKNTVRTC